MSEMKWAKLDITECYLTPGVSFEEAEDKNPINSSGLAQKVLLCNMTSGRIADGYFFCVPFPFFHTPRFRFTVVLHLLFPLPLQLLHGPFPHKQD